MKKAATKKFIGGILGIAFVITAFFGVHLTMQMDSNGVMQDCPLRGHTETVCAMTVTEHIAKWQQLFTFTLQSNKLLFAGLLLVAFAFAVFLFQLSLFDQLRFKTVGIRAGPPDYSSSFILRALGRGILRKRE